MFVAVARITLSIPESNSLKSKRHVLHKLLDKVKARFNVSIAEVADNDLWQKATIGIAAVANEHAFAQESVDKVVRFIEDLYVAPIIARSSEVIPMGGDLYGTSDSGEPFDAARGGQRTLADAEREAAQREGRAGAVAELDRAAPPRLRQKGGAGRGRSELTGEERERAIEELRLRLRRERQAAQQLLEDDDD